jgi:ABC-2 type transport system permease protein
MAPPDGIVEDRRAGTAVARLSVKRAVRPGVLWGLVFGATVAGTMASYSKSFPTAASRANLESTFNGNAAFEALFGLLRRLDTVAGYTAYKDLYTLLIIGAIWGLFIATKLLRGEEETGRWELLLAGSSTPVRATAQTGVGLAAGALAVWVPTALLSAATGAGSSVRIGVGASLFLATAVTAAVVMFMAVGMLTSQLAATRRGADLLGAAILVLSYFVRMAADADARLGWLRWASPLGWIEELRPLVGSKPLAFVPIVGLTACLTGASLWVAAHRDAGSSVFAARDTPRPHFALLGDQAGLTVRLTRGAIAGWLVALGVAGLCFGLVTQAAGRSLKASPTIERVITRLGATGAGAVTYLGFVFVIGAGLVGVAVSSQVTGMRSEEAEGRLDNLLVRPVARWRWLGARVAVGLAFVVAGAVLTGVAAWIGAATQHAAVGFGRLVEAGINIAPPAVFVLGIGVLVFGVFPRAAVGATYGLVAWSFLIEIFASVSGMSHWVRDSSPFLHITPVPAANPDWTSAAWLVGLGLLAAVCGIGLFSRRDLVGE